ncbi:MAG: GFA family protein [Rhodospirillales bacterium]|nr:GFA family protein [Rhodospirillales bacterium]
MKLEGSCHCGAVRFSLESATPQPYMRCYCSICRKTAGGGGYAINLGGDAETLRVEGEENLTVYRARSPGEAEPGPARRHFCKHCGSALWAFDPRWPELVHPFASAIDTPLPVPPERVHILLDSKANWVQVPEGPAERHFAEYPGDSIIEWHDKHGLTAP